MRKEPVKMFKDKKFLKEIAIILIVGIIVNAFCFLLPLVVHAETAITQLPYLASSNPYRNETEIQSVLEAINQAYPNDTLQNYIVFLSSEYAWWDYNTYIPVKTYIVYNLPGFTYPSSWGTAGSNLTPNASNFDLYGNDYIDLDFENFISYSCQFRSSGLADYNGMTISRSSGTTTTRRFFSSYQPIHIENSKFNFDYLQNYPVYTNVSWYTTDNQANAITYLTDGLTDGTIGEFEDLPPLDSILNNITNSFNSHTNNTPPTYDDSLSDGENITNSIDSLADNLNNALNNLGSNLKSWFDNLQKKLTDTTNAILGGLYNGFATLNKNFKDFFGAKLDAIIDKLDYFQEPFSAEDLAENLNNASFSSDFLGLINTVGTFSTAFTSGSEPNSCSFTLDFSNSYYDFGVCEFSLDWILPFRSTIRLIVGCLCVYSLIVSIFTSLNTYIGGTSSINDDI